MSKLNSFSPNQYIYTEYELVKGGIRDPECGLLKRHYHTGVLTPRHIYIYSLVYNKDYKKIKYSQMN